MNIQGNDHQVLTAINDSDHIFIFHHIRPDGDCLGAGFGLRELIKINYPHKRVFFLAGPQETLSFMNFQPDHWTKIKPEWLKNSLAIVVDAGNSERIQFVDILINNFDKRLRIDHHHGVADINYDYLYVAPNYAACCQQIAELAQKFHWKINQEVVQYLMLGILTDTGRFNYGNLTSELFKVIAWMLETTKFNYFNLVRSLNYRDLSELKYESYVLKHYQITGRVAWFIVSKAVRLQFQLTEQNAARVDILANLVNCQSWVFFVEQVDGSYRARLRSNCLNIRLTAEHFGGGGHNLAAGCTVNFDQIPEVIKMINEANNFDDQY